MRVETGVLVGRALLRFVLLAIVVRLVRDTGTRMMYPFIPEYARGLGISLTAMGALMMVRTAMVMLAPLFGNLADRHGPKRLLLVGILAQSAGLLWFSLAAGLWSGLGAIALLGLSDALFMPLMQAYVGEHAPATRRGWALATVEYSWAIIGIAILPLVGWLIAATSWQMPFRLLSFGSIFTLLILVGLMPPDVPRRAAARTSLWANARAILRDRSAAGSLIAFAAFFMATETFFVVWGVHLERNFGLGPAQIGQVAGIIGVAELVGSIVASIVLDRVGRRRGLLGGAVYFILILLFMPWLNRSLSTLIIGFALISTGIEYNIVSGITLLADQRPGSRATMLAMGAMTGAGMRSITDSIVIWLFDSWGFLVTLSYAFVAVILAAWTMWRWVEERGGREEQPE
ncbi:MAG: MFS transporter [Caldilineales bacterium]|nr:MFS transporter [Caldilineales bacterium]